MKKKKIIAFSAALTLILSALAGCHSTSQPAENVSMNVQTTVIDATTEIIEEPNSETAAPVVQDEETDEPEDTASVEFPDLSAYGIDSSEFTRTDDPYLTQRDSEADTDIDFISYKNENGDRLFFYPDGRFNCYLRGTYFDDLSYEGVKEEYRERAIEVLKTVVPDLDEFTEQEIAGRSILFTKKGDCDDLDEYAEVLIDPDGNIGTLWITRSGITDAEAVDRLREKAQEAAENRWKDIGDFNYVTVDNANVLFKVGERNCGIFDYTVSEGDPEALGCYEIFVCDE